MAIAPIQGVSGTTLTIPVTPVRPVVPARVAQVLEKAAQAPTPPSAEAVQAEVRGKAVATAVQTAAPRQTALAPLFADLGQALKARALPAPVQAAAAQVLAQATPLGPNIDGATIARAFAQSGLFLEHNLGARPGATPAGKDLKADLLSLRAALAGWLGAAKATASPRGGAQPPPPYRGGPTTAQPAARPALGAQTAPIAVGQRLAEDIEGALARHELMQIASLPAEHASPDEAQTTRWMFEAPFTTPQGASVAQFEISRDDAGSGRAGGKGPVYRARFSIDLEPLGPIHAHVTLDGEQAGVTLWAERDGSVELLRRSQAWLAQALTQAALEPDISVYAGAPPRPAPGAGKFVDASA